MSKRLNNFVTKFLNAGMEKSEIVAGIQNSEIESPEWMGNRPDSNIGFVLWDEKESGGDINLYALE